MDQDLWKAVNRIFHAALEVDIAQRRDLVVAQSNGDPEVQAEVELLLQADAAAGSYLETPGTLLEAISGQTHHIIAGEVLCGRFRIVREIAEGGMGRVFEAFDTELAVRVALKVIRSEIASNPEVIARFRQEVRLARSITHPNICRTFDLERETRVINGQNIDTVFLTMEFISGETLSSRIKRTGALPLSETLGIAKQIASALHSAHTMGITHRDMKPANIMLVGVETSQVAPRAVVTDFGLARLDPLLLAGNLSALTKTSYPIGTLAYMAPEQLEGKEVSPATDIYTFGLILFEMITGKRAFPSDNPLSGIAQRLRGSVPLERLLPRDVPSSWHRVLKSCLAVDPTDRPKSANEIIHLLEKNQVGFTWTLRDLFAPFRKLRSRAAVIITIFVAVMALFFLVLRLHTLKASSGVPAGALVYLTPVKNETSEKSFDTLTELIQAGLSQSAQLNLLDQSRVGDILQQMTRSPDSAIDANTAREIALRAGAARVIFATITGSRGKFSLNVDIQQPDNDPSRYRDHWTKTFSWQASDSADNSSRIPSDLLNNIRFASDWIRHEIGESVADIARFDGPPAEVTTGNWQALTEYTHGERLAARGNSEDAVLAFDNAIVRDPDFALAYARKGDLLISLNRAIDGYRMYNRALSTDLDHRLTRKERDFIKGAYANDTGDYVAGEAAFRDFGSFYENDLFGIFFQAFPLRMMGRYHEAIQVLKRAHEIAPASGGPYVGLAYNYMLLHDYAAAHQAIDDLRKLGRREDAAMLGGNLAFLEGRPSDASALFDSLYSGPDPAKRSLGYALSARLTAEYGRYSEAIETLNGGIENDLSRGDRDLEASKLLDRAYLRNGLGNDASSLEDVRQAIELEARPDYLIRASSILGSIINKPHIRRQLRAAVVSQLKALEQKLPTEDFGVIFDLARMRIRGELFLAQSKPQQALTAFRKADTLDSPSTDREYLARALVVAANARENSLSSDALRDEALTLRGRVATNPSIVWYYSPSYPPGFWADEMKAYLDLAARRRRSGEVVQQIQEAYKKMRPHAASRPLK